MLEIKCDNCNKNCGLVSYRVIVEALHNPTPHSVTDTGPLALTHDHTSINFILCQDCYRAFGLPNIYKAHKENKVTFREDISDGREENL